MTTAHHTDHPKAKAKVVKHSEADLRDEFACRLAAAALPSAYDHPESVAAWAEKAYLLADALLLAREPEVEEKK